MAFTLVQAGTALYSLNPAGGQSPALTLPSGVTLASNRVPRFARFKNYVVVVNTPSRPLSVGIDGTVRVLTPAPPSSPLVLSGASGGTLTGTFTAKQTFLLLDANNNVISESDYGPVSNTVTIATQYLKASNVNLSTDAVSASRLYRTTDLGVIYFPWMDVDGNVNIVAGNDLPDAGLELLEGPSLGSPPDLVLIGEWAGRLWGVGRGDGDNLRWSEAGTMYAWPGINTLPIPHVGDDRYGITALMPRRDSLGVGRRNQILQVTGATNDEIRPIILKEGCGVQSQESVVTWRDTVYFLSHDGVYKWDDDGIVCLSDQGNVRSWFTTNQYFNQGMFSQAFALFDPVQTNYRLFLCSPGSVVPDRWVELDVETGKWFGPHKTDAFQPTCGITVRGTNDQPFAMIGSKEGHISQDVDLRSDWGTTPIQVDVITKRFIGGDPDRETFFGEPSIFLEGQPSGSMTLTPIVGGLNKTTPSLVQTIPLTKSRYRAQRLGVGRHAQLEFKTNARDTLMVLHGFTIPTVDVGRR